MEADLICGKVAPVDVTHDGGALLAPVGQVVKGQHRVRTLHHLLVIRSHLRAYILVASALLHFVLIKEIPTPTLYNVELCKAPER